MYAFNCPTFLLTQTKWKLFFENEDRDRVFTFPYDTDPLLSTRLKANLSGSVGRTFLKVIVICLLSGIRNSERTTDKVKSITPVKDSLVKKRYIETSERPRPTKKQKDEAGASTSDTHHVPKAPRFVAGFLNGQPVYQEIRIRSAEEVAEIEKEEALLLNADESCITVVPERLNENLS